MAIEKNVAIISIMFFVFIMLAGAFVIMDESTTVIEEVLQYFFGSGGDIIRTDTYEARMEVNEYGGETRNPDYEMQTSGIQSNQN